MKATGEFVLLKNQEPASQSKGGLYLPDSAIKNDPLRLAEIVSIGCKVENGLELGQKCYYQVSGSLPLTVGDEKFVILKYYNIVAVL